MYIRYLMHPYVRRNCRSPVFGCYKAPDRATSGCRRDGLICLQDPQAAHGGDRLAARLQRCLLLAALHEPGVCVACRVRTCKQGAGFANLQRVFDKFLGNAPLRNTSTSTG